MMNQSLQEMPELKLQRNCIENLNKGDRESILIDNVNLVVSQLIQKKKLMIRTGIFHAVLLFINNR